MAVVTGIAPTVSITVIGAPEQVNVPAPTVYTVDGVTEYVAVSSVMPLLVSKSAIPLPLVLVLPPTDADEVVDVQA